MSTPPITAWVPKVSANPQPDEIHRHLTLLFQKLGNHTQAFQLQQAKINAIKSGTSTTIEEGGSGGGSIIPFTPQPGMPVNNQSGVTSYSTVTGDNGALIVLSDASPIAVSLTPETPPWGCFAINIGAGTATFTPSALGASTPTINGGASFALLPNYLAVMGFDGSNWWTGGLQLSIADIAGLPAALALLAPLASPALTGTPTAPTATPLTDDTQIATTAYADAAVGVEKTRALAAEASLAPKASPTFTGTVTQPTPDVLTAATTATSATAGAASALPVTPLGYLEMSVNGVIVKIPYYSV